MKIGKNKKKRSLLSLTLIQGIFEVVQKPADRNVVRSKWIYIL